jgi:3-oxoadipate enol-lactonase
MGGEPLSGGDKGAMSATPAPAAGNAGYVKRPDGVNIYYETVGEGRPVVLVAGLGDDRTSWSGQVPALAGDHLVVTFDNRGIGNSTVPSGPYSIEQMADDAHAVVEELGLAAVSAIGSSMGGAICQRWALRYPGDLERLVLTNTWAERDAFLDAVFAHWIALGEDGSGQRILESLLVFCFSAGYLRSNPTTVRDFLALPPPPAAGFAGGAHACRGHEALDDLDEIRQPTLVIAGGRDILTRPELSERIVELLPVARLALLPSGHMIFWERPEAFTDLVRRFLEEAV